MWINYHRRWFAEERRKTLRKKCIISSTPMSFVDKGVFYKRHISNITYLTRPVRASEKGPITVSQLLGGTTQDRI